MNSELFKPLPCSTETIHGLSLQTNQRHDDDQQPVDMTGNSAFTFFSRKEDPIPTLPKLKNPNTSRIPNYRLHAQEPSPHRYPSLRNLSGLTQHEPAQLSNHSDCLLRNIHDDSYERLSGKDA